MAVQDEDANVRGAAIQTLDDPELTARIAVEDPVQENRFKAATRLGDRDTFVQLALEVSSSLGPGRAVDYLFDAEALARVCRRGA